VSVFVGQGFFLDSTSYTSYWSMDFHHFGITAVFQFLEHNF